MQVKVIYYILIYDHVKIIYIIMGRAKHFNMFIATKKMAGHGRQGVRLTLTVSRGIVMD